MSPMIRIAAAALVCFLPIASADVVSGIKDEVKIEWADKLENWRNFVHLWGFWENLFFKFSWDYTGYSDHIVDEIVKIRVILNLPKNTL